MSQIIISTQSKFEEVHIEKLALNRDCFRNDVPNVGLSLKK